MGYNGNYDYWVSNHFLLEIPANGVVFPVADPEVFRPVIVDFGVDMSSFVVDTCLLIVAVFYVGIWQLLHHKAVAKGNNKELREQIDKHKKAVKDKSVTDVSLPPDISKFKTGWFKREEYKQEKNMWNIILHGNAVIDILGITC